MRQQAEKAWFCCLEGTEKCPQPLSTISPLSHFTPSPFETRESRIKKARSEERA